MQVEKRPLALCTNVIFYFYGHYACAYCMFILQGQTVKVIAKFLTFNHINYYNCYNQCQR